MLTPKQAKANAEACVVKYCDELKCATAKDTISALTSLISTASRVIRRCSSNDKALKVLEDVGRHISTIPRCPRCGDDAIGADEFYIELHGACSKCLRGVMVGS